MIMDTEATETVRRLNLQCPKSTESLQVAVHEALALATAPRPAQEEYYYDSDDSVVDLDEQYPDLVERIMQWQAGSRLCPSMASTQFWSARAGHIGLTARLAGDTGPSQGHPSG